MNAKKDRLLFITLIAFLIWQSVPAFIATILFCILRYYKVNLWLLVLLSLVTLISTLIYQQTLLLDGLKDNILFIRLLFKYGYALAGYYEVHEGWPYLIGLSPSMATVLYLIDRLCVSPHAESMIKMAKNEFPESKDLTAKAMNRIMRDLTTERVDGILLGASLKTGNRIVIPDAHINQVAIVLGTTGSGKTITLQRFFHRAIIQGYPLIIIDGKPTDTNIHFVSQLSRQHNRTFYGFNCGDFHSYNPLACGGHTELKDKIMTLKDHWDNDYYRAVASDYLQTAIEILIGTEQKIDLSIIARCLDYDYLTQLLRKNPMDELISKVKALEHYDRPALTGLQAHLNLLVNSELGKFFAYNEDAFSLKAVIDKHAVAYFALPALRFSDFANVLGKLVINDIKSVIEPLSGTVPIFIIFDEFSIFAGDQVLNLINMGRGKGVHAVLGAQGLADLKKVGTAFESQVLNCVNTVICHRMNHQTCAETISKWIGTYDKYDLTTQIDLKANTAALGSASCNKSFIVHPDEIKQALGTGEAFYVTKVGGFAVDKVRVLYDLSTT